MEPSSGQQGCSIAGDLEGSSGRDRHKDECHLLECCAVLCFMNGYSSNLGAEGPLTGYRSECAGVHIRSIVPAWCRQDCRSPRPRHTCCLLSRCCWCSEVWAALHQRATSLGCKLHLGKLLGQRGVFVQAQLCWLCSKGSLCKMLYVVAAAEAGERQSGGWGGERERGSPFFKS